MWPVLFGFLHLALMFSRSFHIVVCFGTSFIFLWWVIVHWMHISILNFIYSSVDGHLGHFQLLAIVNSAAVNIHVEVFEYLFLILFGIYLGIELLGHMRILCLTFWKTSPILFHSSLTILHSPLAMPEGCNFYTSLSTLVILHF